MPCSSASFLRVALLSLLFSVGAYGQSESQAYLPLTRAEVSKKFPVKYVGTLGNERPGYFESKADKALPERLGIGLSGAVVTRTGEGNLIITGKDKHKKDWSVQLGDSVLAYNCRFYEADLDRNRITDVVLLFPTGGNGLAPTNHLLAITFDEQGRPLTFEADGYFQDLGNRIFDLVDLDRDGRAELLYMNFDDGYWITSLYEVGAGRWQRISGRHGGRRFPLYTRFTNRANRRPTTPKRGRHPFAPDLSNSTPNLQGRLVSYRWADVSQSEDILLRIADSNGREISSQPVSWYGSFAIVLDTEEGRRIVSLSTEEGAVKALLDKIVSGRYAVALYGQRQPDKSSPEMLWAQANDRR